MRKTFSWYAALLTLASLPLSTASPTTAVQSKRVLGVTEPVRLDPEGVVIFAKLDTGASMTSLDARAIRMVERSGKQWVLFDYHDKNAKVTLIERPLLRIAVVRPAPDVVERRPVVMMRLCMGGVQREVQVNLVDRSTLNSRMLIGRNFLVSAQFVVDSAVELTSTPDCKEVGK